ncbi:MAG: bifunctional DedA family/phosphatase PAP2 family protein [Sedimenticola sp.]
MTDYFYQLLDWVSLHPLWSGAVIFLVAMSESLAIVGLIVPGVVIMFGIGALIAAGAIDFAAAMAWAVAGAVAGDGLSFWLGYHYRERLTGIWPFTRYPSSLDQGIAFFDRYGGKSVAFGRFFGPVRAIIPLVAGMMGMQPWRFVVANVLSALVWAPAYLLPGMVFGASLELASEVAFRLVILLLLLALLIWLAFRVAKGLFALMHPHAGNWVQATLRWSRMHPKVGDIAAALADPEHPEAKGLSILASLLLLATALFALLLGAVLEGSALATIDHTVLHALQSLRTPWADHLMVTLTRLTDTPIVIALTLGVLIFLVWHRHRRTTLYWLAAVGFAVIVPPLLKHGLQIPRPEVLGYAMDADSFPSGHTLKAVVLYGFLSVIIARPIQPRWRWLPYAVAASLALAVGLSRLYLGVHWLSDVLGSITLGVIWIALLGIAYHRHAHPETHWRGLSAATACILVAAMGIESSLNHQQRIAQYSPRTETTEMTGTAWWSNGWERLPASRQDTRGRLDHPLNLQFAGDPRWLSEQLGRAGWRVAEGPGWEDMLKLLSPSLKLESLPILPQVHGAQHESLTLEKPISENRRLVLRLWTAHARLTPGNIPLWLGNVAAQQKVQAAGLLTFAETSHDFGEPYETLLSDLSALPAQQVSARNDRVLIRAQ